MTTKLDHSDLPITAPEEDLFGIHPFVSALARSMRGMSSPQGVVVGVNGPWGSGKSSAINLLKHDLDKAENLEVVSFNPWWFRGEEALVLAFFRELYAATKPSLGERAKKALPKLGARLLKAGGAVSAAADLAGASGAGSLASGTMSWLSELIKQDESVESLHVELSSALRDQGKRYVVLIDDIDRLSPDEALAMFRLVKSVGRLPNVIYVLAFDRQLAEKVVQERYPSEGPHYLEKIVQASFEVPSPDPSHLHQVLLEQLFAISGKPEDDKLVHVMNLFYEIVAPEVRTPRDVVRLLNTFAVTWPAVVGEVDQGDFIALEAYRVFKPAIYAAIRANPSLVSGWASTSRGHVEGAGDRLDEALLGGVAKQARYRQGLMRLFPKLESVWANTYYDSDQTWAKDRRACSPEHFGTYFRLSPGGKVLPRERLRQLMAATEDAERFQSLLLEAAAQTRADGTSNIPIILDALTLHAEEVPLERLPVLLGALFSVADRIVVDGDRGRPFEYGTTPLRLHWLIRALTKGRMTLEERSALYMGATRVAELGWLADFSSSAWRDYHPREGTEPSEEANRLVTEAAAADLRHVTRERIEQAATSGALIEHPDLAHLLYRWLDTSDDGGAAVRAWTITQLAEAHSVALLCQAFTSYSWVQGLGMFSLGDLVSRRVDRVSLSGVEKVVNKDELISRAREVAGARSTQAQDSQIITRFLDALDRSEPD